MSIASGRFEELRRALPEPIDIEPDAQVLAEYESMFRLLLDQSALRALFRNANIYGADTVDIELTEGVRDDRPAMKFFPESVCLVISKGERSSLEVSVYGRIMVASDDLSDAPTFENKGQLKSWLNEYYAGGYRVREVKIFDKTSWVVEMSRNLLLGELAMSHATRVDDVFSALKVIISGECMMGVSEIR